MNIFQNADIAEKYDEYYKSEFGSRVDQIEKSIISDLLAGITKCELLDVGCGTGHWTEFFVSQGFAVTGVDISDSMLNIAKSKAIKAEFIKADSQKLPFSDESYEAVATITMLEFVDNQADVINELYRVLKKGGYLIVGGLNADSVIGKNRSNDEVFKHGDFFRKRDLIEKFNQFEFICLSSGVYLNDKFEIMDDSNDISNIEPVFFGILLRKV